jgi:AAA+ ATPase superfamily predicted ATPase
MENPFVYGKEVSGDNFCNRKDEIEELYRDTINSQNVIVFSQRRFGKTSLIKEVLKKSRNNGILTIYVDLYSVLNEEDLVRKYARAVAESLLGKVDRALRQAGEFFKRIRPKLTVDETGQPSYSIDIEKREALPLLEDTLEAVKRYVEQKKKKAAVVFDEFQQIGQLKTDKAERIMRSSIQRHKDIAYIFMGSKKHLISDMFNNPNRPFYKSSKPFPLNKIDKNELLDFIQTKFQNTKKILPKELAEKIIETCECHPYYIQYFCNIIWERIDAKETVKEENFLESLELLLSRESSTYETTWDLLTLKQKQVLLALAKAEPDEKIFSSSFLEKHSLGSASSVQRTLHSLIDKDLIDKEGEFYTIIDIFFKKWFFTIQK